MLRTAIMALCVATMAMACCSDPVAPADPNEYTGTNGFVIHGGDFSHEKVDFTKSSVEFLDPLGAQRGIRLDQATLGDAPTTLILVLPSNVTSAGTYTWVSESEFDATKPYIVIEQDDEPAYASVQGETKITTFGAVGGNVVGTFNGTVTDAEKKTTYTIQGKFSAVRVN